MGSLFKVFVMRKQGESYCLVRTYLCVAENQEGAKAITPLFKDEYVGEVRPETKSPLVYLLHNFEG